MLGVTAIGDPAAACRAYAPGEIDIHEVLGDGILEEPSDASNLNNDHDACGSRVLWSSPTPFRPAHHCFTSCLDHTPLKQVCPAAYGHDLFFALDPLPKDEVVENVLPAPVRPAPSSSSSPSIFVVASAVKCAASPAKLSADEDIAVVCESVHPLNW